MAFWLADARRGQARGYVKRFDPAFWTVDFPRPVMASVVTQADEAEGEGRGLRVEAAFYGSGDLIGLIWDARDDWDHPLLAYETRRDFRHCVLSFRWRSGGVKPLDAVHGPTLTIEGRDAEGHPRAWYVRLWNYASGTGEDAAVRIDFDALEGGFTLPEEADPVFAGDIDRMFISLVAPGYDGGDTPFASVAKGWAEMRDIACDGSGSVLAIGEAMLPEHGLSIATGYDDLYNQTPERVLRGIEALGYRGDVLHYVGMSHFPALERAGDGWHVGAGLCDPARAWHADFCARAKAMALGVILSLSFELFDEYCPEAWKQRAFDGTPALTGWVPPSTLLSPAHDGAMDWLCAVARDFAGIARDAGLAVKFQVGEPWWWVTGDHRICLYDDAARAAFGGDPVEIADVRGAQGTAARALLDEAGAMLASATARVADAVRDEAPGALLHLLIFLPSILDPAAPDVRRANLPPAWAAPAFDVLQIEDYDWVTAGRGDLSAAGRAEAAARFGYDAGATHYLAGFVLRREDAGTQWPLIAAAAEGRWAREATFIWALPQVNRDGFTFFAQEDAMQAFDDVDFPIAIGRQASVAAGFSTQVIESLSGVEQRSADWADARMHYDAGPGVRSESDLQSLIAFFRARRGAARAFRFRDPYDWHSGSAETWAAGDQLLGLGDGVRSRFPLRKLYGQGEDAQERRITLPVAGSVRVALNGVAQASGWTLTEGEVIFAVAPAPGVEVRAGFAFDVPVRFAEDRLEVSAATFAAGEAVSVPLVEVRR